MKREDTPTERLQEKRVEERGGGRERERAHARRRERERERALAPPFMSFSLHLGLPYANRA